MDLKTCTKCNEPKDPNEFNDKTPTRKQSWCKSCMSEYHSTRYLSHPTYKRDMLLCRKKHIEEARLFVINYLSTHPCVDCGEPDIIVLEFDHRGDKLRNLSRMVNNGNSLKTLQREIDKCVVRCANCHRRATAKQFNTFKFQATV